MPLESGAVHLAETADSLTLTQAEGSAKFSENNRHSLDERVPTPQLAHVAAAAVDATSAL